MSVLAMLYCPKPADLNTFVLNIASQELSTSADAIAKSAADNAVFFMIPPSLYDVVGHFFLY